MKTVFLVEFLTFYDRSQKIYDRSHVVIKRSICDTEDIVKRVTKEWEKTDPCHSVMVSPMDFITE